MTYPPNRSESFCKKGSPLSFQVLLRAGLFVLLLVISHPAFSRTWYIKPDGTGDAPTIQAGVDSALAGDTVLVAPGVYADTTQILVNSEPKSVNVCMCKNIVLLAEGSPDDTMIDGSKRNIAIYVENVDAAAEIRGFKIITWNDGFGCLHPISSHSLSSWEPIGIKCRFSSPTIAYNEISDNGIAIELIRSPVKIYNNEIHFSDCGIVCDDSSDAEIQGNTIYDCADCIQCLESSPRIVDNEIFMKDLACRGIYCEYSSSVYIARNHIHDLYNEGIDILEDAGANIIIEDNLIERNWNGIRLTSSGPVTIRRNIFVYNGASVHLSWTPSTLIENNTIDHMGYGGGIYCELGSNPLIRKNIIVRTSYGIGCFWASPIIECNNIYDAEDRYAADCSDQTGINGNISVDPEFCGIYDSGNYYLQSDSPCAAGNHPDGYDCGMIGAFDVGCKTTPARKATWGSMKSFYKGVGQDSVASEKK